MKKRFFSLVFLLMNIFVSANALEALDVRLGQHNDVTRFVIELSDKTDFKVFILKQPDRAVIDLPMLAWKGHDDLQKKGVVESFRHGAFDSERMRFVLDLAQPSKISKAFILKPIEGRSARFVLDLTPLKHGEILQDSGKQVGNLNPKQQQAVNTILADAEQLLKGAPATTQKKLTQPTSPKKPVFKDYSVKKKPGQKTIVLDAGHGGIDPGAIGRGKVYEKHVTLAVTKLLKKELESKGFKVVLTRDRDVFVRLRDRIRIARRAKGDLFISLHADSARNPRATGFSIYTLSNTASDKESQLLAQRENKVDIIAGIDFTEESEQVTSILIDLAQRETMNQSKQFANLVVGDLKSAIHLRQSPHKFAGFTVLKGPDIPAALIELGFLSNASEARKLKSTSHQRKLAREISKAIQHYFKVAST